MIVTHCASPGNISAVVSVRLNDAVFPCKSCFHTLHYKCEFNLPAFSFEERCMSELQPYLFKDFLTQTLIEGSLLGVCVNLEDARMGLPRSTTSEGMLFFKL